MVVGIARIVLGIPESRSLKDKRSVVRRVIDRVRHKFNAAVAEVDDLDAHRRATIGITVVSNDARHVSSMLETISSFVSTASSAVVLDRATEIEHYNDRAFGDSGRAHHFGTSTSTSVGFASAPDEDDDGEP
jgi:uncharacterized protein YlxP (DUF503 family)